ncbi:MAG TPA: hypothetical protein VGL71_06465, partial [Urbifossiella sp.]
IAKLKLIALGLVAVGLTTLAGFGTLTALGQRPISSGRPSDAALVQDQKAQPTITPAGDSITAYPDLDPKSFEDLILKCPKMLGGKADLLGPEKITIGPNDPALLQLQKAKLNAAIADLSLILERFKAGNQLSAALGMGIPETCNRAVAAASDVYSGTELRPWLEERVRVAKWYEKVAEAGVKAGQKLPSELNAARYARLDAEIALLKLTSRKNAAGR